MKTSILQAMSLSWAFNRAKESCRLLCGVSELNCDWTTRNCFYVAGQRAAIIEGSYVEILKRSTDPCSFITDSEDRRLDANFERGIIAKLYKWGRYRKGLDG